MTEGSHTPNAGGTETAAAPPIRIIKGLDIPIGGEPEQNITSGAEVRSVALIGGDYIGLRPLMHVEEGDRVRLGQPLFADRSSPEVLFTAPGSGFVRQINRGTRRVLQSAVIELAGDDEETFDWWPVDRLAHLRRDQVADTLLASGLWTALRTRPFSKVPDPKTTPSSIFVTAMDSNPLAASAEIVIDTCRQDFANGLTAVSHLTDGPIFVCQAPRVELPQADADNISTAKFSGPHPSGIVGTHIHFLDPAGANKIVWHVGYQDVIAIGRLFTTGRLSVERIVALAGPVVKLPRLIRTRLGANTDDLTLGELQNADSRIISGSVLSGRHARGPHGYLGRFHNQVSVIAEARPEQRKSWIFQRRKNEFSAYDPGAGRPHQAKKFTPTTALHGASGILFPLGGFERIMPLDILPTQLLRALLVGDTDTAQGLGCLELDEEDLALCSFVCPGKIDYGALLRVCLERIAKEG